MDFVTSGHRGLIGVGFYIPAAVATVVTLMTRSLFRWLERSAPTLLFARLVVRFVRGNSLTENAVRVIQQQHVRATHIAYRLTHAGKYRDDATEPSGANEFGRLAERPGTVPEVLDDELTPTGKT